MQGDNLKNVEQAIQSVATALQQASNSATKIYDLTNQFVAQGVQFTSTSTSFVDVTGFVFTYTTGRNPERLFLQIQTLCKISVNTSAISLGISVNGVDVGKGGAYDSNTDWASQQATVVYDALPNTTYTFKLRAKVATAATTLTVANDTLFYQTATLFAQPVAALTLAQAQTLQYTDISSQVSFNNFTIGNGTITARQAIVGDLVHVMVDVVTGSTSSCGTGIELIVPTPRRAPIPVFHSPGQLALYDSANTRVGFIQWKNTTTLYSLVPTVSGTVLGLSALTNTFPFASFSGAGRYLSYNFTYEKG